MQKPSIVLSQSLVKMLFRKWNELPDDMICYRKIYAQYVLGLRTKPTIPNLRGLLFEDLCCDTNNNNVTLPKHNKSGRKLVDELRIEQQAHIFKEWVRSVHGTVNETVSQVTIYKHWDKDPNVIISGKLDIFPFLHYDVNTGEFIVSILDLKYTGDITSTFGKFPWGEPERMDHLQAIWYLYLVMNIDYKLNDSLNRGNLLKEFTNNSKIRPLLDSGNCTFKYYVADSKSNFSSDVFIYTLKPDDFAQLFEVIRKTVNLLRTANENNWPANPTSLNCLGNSKEGIYPCPFINCSYRKKEREI